ncbi:PHD-zinc-finger like domain-containing protein [Gorgonomyces haynaldii]|nr:PHD-zinc-finger like domain-containing protein [Gorgonomyces haynaldii]
MQETLVPAEERPFTDFYPDLNIALPIIVVPIDPEPQPDLDGVQYTRELPKLVVEFSKPVPTPVFVKSGHSRLDTVQRIERFSKFKEPTEQELFELSEYDMDEQDRNWLEKFNIRHKDSTPLTEDMFELVIDRLEKCWFELVKDMPKTNRDDVHYPEEVLCAVCDDGDAENSNAIVFCDGCNMAVHQDCYGIPFVPEGQWLCRKCMISPDQPVSCLLCPVEGGAFKQTTNNQWGHLACAMWIPECRIANTAFMEPIEGIDQIPKSRWKLMCYICKQRRGAPIQCSSKHCFVPFHVGCARLAKLPMQIKGQGDQATFRAFCDRHSPKGYLGPEAFEYYIRRARKQIGQQRFTKKRAIHESEDETPSIQKKRGRGRPPKIRKIVYEEEAVMTPKKETPPILQPSSPGEDPSESVQIPEPHVSTTSPIIPVYILNQVLEKCGQINPEYKREDVIISISKYWALKREARRGAALLKRLHLEPWTALRMNESKEEKQEKMTKYQSLLKLRKCLERTRSVVELLQMRERERIRLWHKELQLLQEAFNPLGPVIRPTLKKCQELDRHKFFEYPVDTALVPDYLDIIEHPMDYTEIHRKLDNFEYQTIDQFIHDIALIYNNCILYNKPDTPYCKAAIKLQQYFESVIGGLRERAALLIPNDTEYIEAFQKIAKKHSKL